MLSVTESALDHLSGVLIGEEPERVLRLTTTKDGLALVADQTRPGDEVHEHKGKALLVLDEAVATAIRAQTLDVAVRDGKATLTLR